MSLGHAETGGLNMAQIFRRIVVALDRSRPAAQARELAMRLARTQESELLFVHAVDYSLLQEECDPAIVDAVTRNGNEILRQAKNHAADAGVPSRTALLEGRADYAVTRYAEEIAADAIVVGTRGPATSERFFLGSTAQGILRLAIAPVFIVHDVPLPLAAIFKRIVVAIDNSDPSDAAIELGTQLAAADGSRLAFCHVVDEETLYEEAANFGGATYPVLHEWLDEAAILSRSAASQAEGSGVRSVETSVLTGNPVTEILNFAASQLADLIVIGAHGRRGLRYLLMGSVAQAVVRRSTIPVLVVRTRIGAAPASKLRPHVDQHGYVTLRSDA
jgi:nucleotide-binding universal stress UspA family protein